MPKFIVIDPLQHDGKAYAAGDTVTLSDEQAAPLLAAAVVESPTARRARPELEPAQPAPEPEPAPAPEPDAPAP